MIEGRLLKIRAGFEKVKMVFRYMYTPTSGTERLAILDVLNNVCKKCCSEEFKFLGGDFNCTENAVLGRNHQEPNAASRACLIKLVETNERVMKKRKRQNTWVHTKDNSLSLARLDRFYCFENQANVFKGGSIVPVGISDHSLVQCSVCIKDVKCSSAVLAF